MADVFVDAPLPVHLIESPSWRGTGPTLAAGLAACKCEWVLRADADDISVPIRAQRQLTHLLQNPHLAVLGSQLSESSTNKRLVLQRRVPLSSHQIESMLKWRNPINHPTVALNRQRALLAGSYRAILGFNWDLWLRLNRNGAVLQNLPDVLVFAEVDNDHLQRRHGVTYAKYEIQFLISCFREHLMSIWEVSLLFLCRLPWRLLPKACLAILMGTFRSETVTKSNW